MKKALITLFTIGAITTSSMSFAWEHGGGWHHGGGFFGGGVRAPLFIAGAALGAAGAIAYNTLPRPYYAPPRVIYEPAPVVYAPQPYYVQQQPAVVPQPYPYRPY